MKSKFEPNRTTEEYDRQYNLFYLSLHPYIRTKSLMGSKKEEEQDKSKVANIVIYDINNQQSKTLFEQVNEQEVITHFLFETAYDKKEKGMEYNRCYSHKIQNNYDIETRSPLDKLLICQRNLESGKSKLWTANKNGDALLLLAELDKDMEWIVDVYNQKVRTFNRCMDEMKIRDYDW
ncbi:hypothetical protein AAG747_09195 [Rapidithrix thailandica]|uniref:Uncharacterized protein n=1 Tax=Rapidithrix thailandica TaxID=413964 RepID=A0AAW9S6K4_9BACT